MKQKSKQEKLAHLRLISHILDEAIAIPGTSYRFGIDPLLGLFPAAGDYIGTALSAYILLQAALLGVSNSVLGRMVVNVMLETLVGIVPMLGDLFDAGWKANKKNMQLLEAYLNSPLASEKASWWFIALLFTGLLIVVIGVTMISVYIWSSLFKLITG